MPLGKVNRAGERAPLLPLAPKPTEDVPAKLGRFLARIGDDIQRKAIAFAEARKPKEVRHEKIVRTAQMLQAPRELVPVPSFASPQLFIFDLISRDFAFARVALHDFPPPLVIHYLEALYRANLYDEVHPLPHLIRNITDDSQPLAEAMDKAQERFDALAIERAKQFTESACPIAEAVSQELHAFLVESLFNHLNCTPDVPWPQPALAEDLYILLLKPEHQALRFSDQFRTLLEQCPDQVGRRFLDLGTEVAQALRNDPKMRFLLGPLRSLCKNIASAMSANGDSQLPAEPGYDLLLDELGDLNFAQYSKHPIEKRVDAALSLVFIGIAQHIGAQSTAIANENASDTRILYNDAFVQDL